MIDLNDLKYVALEHAETRARNGGNVSTDILHMLKHCATEVVEATDAYVNLKMARYENEVNGICILDDEKYFSSELADIICCVLVIAGKEGIDIECALRDCIEKNRRRAECTGDKL